MTEQDLTLTHGLGFSGNLHWVSAIRQSDDLSFTRRLAACGIGCVRYAPALAGQPCVTVMSAYNAQEANRPPARGCLECRMRPEELETRLWSGLKVFGDKMEG